MTKIHKRGSYSSALKEKVSLEALRGEKTLQQIASENSVSPEQVRQWKKQAPQDERTGKTQRRIAPISAQIVAND